MAKANQVGLRAMSVYAVCLSLFLNLYGMDPADYLILVSLCLNLAAVVRTVVRSLKNPMLLIGIFAFFASYAVSSFVGDFNASYVTNFIINVFLFLILVTYCTTAIRLKRVVFYLSLGFGLSVLIASLQAFDLLSTFPGQFDVVRHSRFFGLYGDPNLLGASAVFFCMYWLNAMMSSGGLNAKFLMFAATFFFISLLTLIFSQSRSAWGGFFIAMFSYCLILMRGLRWQTALSKSGIGLVLICVVLFILHTSGASKLIENRLGTASQIESDAEAERFGLFYTVLALGVAASNPLGVGPGNTASTTGLTSQDGDQIGAHNAFVQVAAENGWVAGLIFLYFTALLLLSSLKTSIQGVAPLGVSSLVMFGSLLSLTFCGLFQDLIQWKVAWVVPALYAAMILQNRSDTLGGGLSLIKVRAIRRSASRSVLAKL